MKKEKQDLRAPIHPELRQPLKKRRLDAKGPLWVPEEWKEKLEGYRLIWSAVSAHDKFTHHSRLRMGYTYVLATEVFNGEGIGDDLIQQEYVDGNYICTGTGLESRSYLMKIPEQDYREIMDEEEQIVRESEQKHKQFTRKNREIENYGGIYYDPNS